jgi:hypothetical protein
MPHHQCIEMLKAGGKFELASLTEFVINEGKYEIPTPTYQMVKNYVPFACLVKKGYRIKRQNPLFFGFVFLIYSSSVLVNSSIVCFFSFDSNSKGKYRSS